MSGTYSTSMGDRGRLVIPSELRARQGWEQGRPLLLIETPGGVIMATREQVRDLLAGQLAGADVVEGLLSDRRAAAFDEDRSS